MCAKPTRAVVEETDWLREISRPFANCKTTVKSCRTPTTSLRPAAKFVPKRQKVSEEILRAQQNTGFLLRGRSGVGGETRRSVGCGIPARQVVDETNRP